jgi:hypothetical protein
VAIQPIWPFYSQNALIINFILKKIQKRKKKKPTKKKNWPPHRWWPATPFGLGGGSTATWAKRSNKNLSNWHKGWPNHPLGHWGWFDSPQTGPRGGSAAPHLWGDSATPTIFFFFLNKIYDDGILGIKMPNGLNCHNLKVWGGKVSHLKLWR